MSEYHPDCVCKMCQEHKELREQLAIAHKHIQDMQVTNGSLTQTVDHWKSVAGKLKEALEVCERLDRTPIYEYGQPDRQGNKPGIGQRWRTPKEKSKEALAQYNASRGEEGKK